MATKKKPKKKAKKKKASPKPKVKKVVDSLGVIDERSREEMLSENAEDLISEEQTSEDEYGNEDEC